MTTGWYDRTNRALVVSCPVEHCSAPRGIPCKNVSGIGTHSARITKADASRARRVDLFKDTYASRLLRLALERGTTTLIELKREQHRLGGTQGNIMHTLGTYTRGANAVLQRGGKINRSISVRWIGSTGESFADRASNWLATLDNDQIEAAHGRVEIEFIEAGAAGDELRATGDWHGGTLDEMRASSWLELVRFEIAQRSYRSERRAS